MIGDGYYVPEIFALEPKSCCAALAGSWLPQKHEAHFMDCFDDKDFINLGEVAYSCVDGGGSISHVDSASNSSPEANDVWGLFCDAFTINAESDGTAPPHPVNGGVIPVLRCLPVPALSKAGGLSGPCFQGSVCGRVNYF